MQGDLLEKTEALNTALALAHPYYASHEHNRYFLVLTQSCDLVKGRGYQGPCKARYISLAPVRPISVVLERAIETEKCSVLSKHIPVCSARSKQRITQLLERIINNNEADYFYLQREPLHGLAEDCCAFLRLPIAFRAVEHYDTCLAARLLSLAEPFQAKLGWLAGQLFSRVGTQDWPAPELSKRIKEITSDVAVWIEDKKMDDLRRLGDKWSEENPGTTLDADVLRRLIKSVPDKKDKVLKRVEEIIKAASENSAADGSFALSGERLSKLLLQLRNDQVISQLLR
jgi:hypothetical protein